MVKMIFSEQQPPVWYIPVDDGVADIVICLNEEAIQVDDPDEPEGYHTDYRYDYNKFRTDTLTEDEVLVSPERYLMFGKDYFSESDRIDFLDTEFAKTDLANVQDGAVTEEKIADEAITREKLTADDIEGVNGKINLREGTFNYGDGKLRWDGETLDVEGIIRALAGYIAGWGIEEQRLFFEQNFPGTIEGHGWDSVDSKAYFSGIPLKKDQYEKYVFQKVLGVETEINAAEDDIENTLVKGFVIYADGRFNFGNLTTGVPQEFSDYVSFIPELGYFHVNTSNEAIIESPDIRLRSHRFDEDDLLTVGWGGLLQSADSGWETPALASNFELYGTQLARYKKVGRKVSIEGVVTPKTTIAGSATATAIFTLGSDYRPSTTKYLLCQGSGKNTWLLSVTADGVVGISRYGTTATSDIPAGAWLPFYFEFEI